MTNELLQKCIGSNCVISTGSFGNALTGIVKNVNENWIEVETKKGNQLVNSDFITNVKIISEEK